MTIASAANKVILPGNASQTVFSFPFVGVAKADIGVIFTDAGGNQTTLTQGPGATQFQVALTAAVPPALWGIGGTVTYNPSGVPIANGTTLTIVRTLPFTQLTSLQNQASYGQLAQATELELDQLEMQIQQLAEAQARVLSAPIVDSSAISLTLPAAAQRANTGLAFDSAGNVIAGTTPATGLISTAMAPIVNAATIAAAKALLAYTQADITLQAPWSAATPSTLATWTGELIDVCRDFGAKRDGVTNDAAAIQAALNAAQTLNTPIAVYFPPGNYLCNSGLQMGAINSASCLVTLFGDGPSACVITAGAAMAELLRIGPNVGSTTRLSQPAVRGMRLAGGTFCTTAVFHFYNVIYGRFENLRIESGANVGIQGDGNPNTASLGGDPFTQGCFLTNISVRSAAGVGHYYRGVKGSIFTALESDAAGQHGFYWDLENQVSGVNEITENVITNCLAKNCGNAGFAFSGIAKFNICNIEAYICAGPGVLFLPTGSGTSAPSFSNVITGLVVRNCAGGIVTNTGAGILGLDVANVNIAGDATHPGAGIELRAWQRFTLTNVVMVGVPGNGIWCHDDGSPPPGGGTNTAQGVISNVVLIGANQQASQDGILIDGTTAQVRIDGVMTSAAGGSAGFEFVTLSATTETELGNFYLVPNTAGHEISLTGGSVVQYFGLNRINTQPGTLWIPRVNATAVSASGQLYEDSSNSNKLTWMDSAGTKHVINTTP